VFLFNGAWFYFLLCLLSSPQKCYLGRNHVKSIPTELRQKHSHMLCVSAHQNAIFWEHVTYRAA